MFLSYIYNIYEMSYTKWLFFIFFISYTLGQYSGLKTFFCFSTMYILCYQKDFLSSRLEKDKA